jgi:RND family efflux transporter MFP subunit
MKRTSIAIVPLLMAASFGLGRWRERPVTASPAPAGPVILYYHDPMHPEYRSDRPGRAPDCGMDLVPVYAKPGEQPAAPKEHEPRSLHVAAGKQQLIGVQFGTAEESAGPAAFRTYGRIVPDEARVYRLVPKVDGWVRRIFPAATGELVKKGQPLVSVYSKDFQVAQQAYIFALNQLERFHNGDEPDALERLKLAAAEALLNLQNLGVPEEQIAEVRRTKKVLSEVNLSAPANGFIVSRTVYPDQRFDRGMDFYRIVDLRRVWIQADLSNPLLRQLVPGAPARVSVPQLPGTTFEARAAGVPPQFDTGSRTLQLRLEADNPGLALKPDMYVDLEFTVPAPRGVTVPRDAVVDSGTHTIVYVDRGNGDFESRPVRTGWRLGDRVEIAEGLAAGERIVISGTFLIDSESRMQAAAHGPNP